MSADDREYIWVTYDNDRGPYVIASFATAEDAARGLASQGYGKIAKWRIGTDFSDAIKEWESGGDV